MYCLNETYSIQHVELMFTNPIAIVIYSCGMSVTLLTLFKVGAHLTNMVLVRSSLINTCLCTNRN